MVKDKDIVLSLGSRRGLKVAEIPMSWSQLNRKRMFVKIGVDFWMRLLTMALTIHERPEPEDIISLRDSAFIIGALRNHYA